MAEKRPIVALHSVTIAYTVMLKIYFPKEKETF